MAERGTKLPFDIADERTIFYQDDMLGIQDAKKELRNAVVEAATDERPDNPVYRAAQALLIEQSADTTDVQRHILDRLDDLAMSVSRLARSKPVPVKPLFAVEITGDVAERKKLLQAAGVEKVSDSAELTVAFVSESDSALLEFLADGYPSLQLRKLPYVEA